MEVDLGDARVVVLPVIRGLAAERPRIRAAVEEVLPSALGLSVSPEELAELRAGPDREPSGSAEEAYVAGLSRFGDVEGPLRCFAEGIAAADRLGVPVHPLDLDEDAFASAYTGAVSPWEFLRSGARASKMHRWEARAQTPEAFVLAWDAEVNSSRGLRSLQRQREDHMVQRIRDLARDLDPVLAVVELERARGVWERLRAQQRG